MKNTIKQIFVIGIWIMMVQVTAFGSEEAKKGSPVAEVVNPEYQFETTVEGSELVHDFFLKNTGTAPLHIEKVKTG
jgi:hypothetical protein